MKYRMFAAALVVPGSLALAQGAVPVGQANIGAVVESSPSKSGGPSPERAGTGVTPAVPVPATFPPAGLEPAIADAATRTAAGADQHALGLKAAILSTWEEEPRGNVSAEPFRLSDEERQAIRDMLRKGQASLRSDSQER